MTIIKEDGCIDGWSSPESSVDGECPDCGAQTINGRAAAGCYHGANVCDTCGYSPCDGDHLGRR